MIRIQRIDSDGTCLRADITAEKGLPHLACTAREVVTDLDADAFQVAAYRGKLVQMIRTGIEFAWYSGK